MGFFATTQLQFRGRIIFMPSFVRHVDVFTSIITMLGGLLIMAKAAAKAPSKSEIFANVAEATGLNKKQVASVFDALAAEVGKALGKKGPGVFAIPGLCKIVRKNKPAQPARKGVMVLGQLRDLPAKAASVAVRVRPLKALKDMV